METTIVFWSYMELNFDRFEDVVGSKGQLLLVLVLGSFMKSIQRQKGYPA